MLRLTDLRLPLTHPPAALAAAVARRLHLTPAALIRCTVARRGIDARRRGAIMLVYAVDVETADEAAVLQRFADDPQVHPTPDTSYRPVLPAARGSHPRPVVIGTGPCGLFATLILAQAGLRPLVLERGKAVRERTKDTWDLWRKRTLHP